MNAYTSAQLTAFKSLNSYFVMKVFVLQILHLNMRKEFCAKAYFQDRVLHKKDLRDAGNYFPQIILPYENTFPGECLHFPSSDSDISISCYNLTLESESYKNKNTDIAFQQTYVFPTAGTLESFKSLITLGELSGLTNVQFKWLVRLSEEQFTFALKTVEEMVKNASFSSVNPLAITMNSVFKETEKMSLNSGIKIFNLNTVLPQTQIHSVDSILDFRLVLNNFLSATTLKVAGVDQPMYDYDTKMGNDSKNRPIFVSGFAVEVLLALQQILNFSVDAVRMDEWGYKDESNEWVGMVAGAIKGEFDLAISSCAEIGSRMEVVDFNMHTHLNKLTAFFRRYSGYPLNPLLLPFQNLLWISILVWMCFCRIIYFLFQYCINYWLHEEDESSFDDRNVFPWIFAPITYRGVPKPPKRIPLQALYLGELIVTVIINAAFSGTLIAHLSNDHNPIKTLDDMVKSEYNLEILESKLTVINLKESSALTASIYQKSQQYERPNKDSENPFKAIVRGKFAYIIHDLGGFGEMNRYLEPLEACTVQYMSMPGAVFKQGSFVRKGSQLKRIIDHGLLKIMETGITNVLRMRYLHQGPNCDHPNEFQGADIYDLQLAFLVFIVSYFASITICILENIWFAYTQRFQGM